MTIPDDVAALAATEPTTAFRAWRILPHTLKSGRRVRPNLRLYAAFKAACGLGLHQFPIVIEEGDYSLLNPDGSYFIPISE